MQKIALIEYGKENPQISRVGNRNVLQSEMDWISHEFVREKRNKEYTEEKRKEEGARWFQRGVPVKVLEFEQYCDTGQNPFLISMAFFQKYSLKLVESSNLESWDGKDVCNKHRLNRREEKKDRRKTLSKNEMNLV